MVSLCPEGEKGSSGRIGYPYSADLDTKEAGSALSQELSQSKAAVLPP